MPENTPISVADARRVTADMATLTAAMGKHRQELRRYRRAVIVLIVAVLVAGFATYRTRQATDANNQSRLDARVSACVQSNVAIDKTRRAITDGILALVPDVDSPDDLPPEQRATYDRYEVRVSASLPYRDCSDAGIKKFYDNPPADPALRP